MSDANDLPPAAKQENASPPADSPSPAEPFAQSPAPPAEPAPAPAEAKPEAAPAPVPAAEQPAASIPEAETASKPEAPAVTEKPAPQSVQPVIEPKPEAATTAAKQPDAPAAEAKSEAAPEAAPVTAAEKPPPQPAVSAAEAKPETPPAPAPKAELPPAKSESAADPSSVPEGASEVNEVITQPTDPPEPKPLTTLVGEQPATAGTKCPTCGRVNRPGVLICETCGTNLLSGQSETAATKKFVGGDAQPAEKLAEEEKSRLAALLANVIRSAGAEVFDETMLLRLEIDSAPTPILINVKREMSLGRRDPATGTTPDVDLTPYAGYRLGVSRKHAVIRLRDRRLEIQDLGSSNGTYVNGKRLLPHHPETLRDGDEIILGKMTIRVLFQIGAK